MPRIIITHLSGSKANSVEDFNSEVQNEIAVGRGVSSSIRYSENDDTVSRDHLHIFQNPDDPNEFTVLAKGRNGTFINEEDIGSTSTIRHGDSVRVGRNGPVFRFELDPPPQSSPDEMPIVNEYHTGDLYEQPVHSHGAIGFQNNLSSEASSLPPASEPNYVGRATFERKISEIRAESKREATRQSRSAILVSGLIALVMVIIVAEVIWNRSSHSAVVQPIARTTVAPVDIGLSGNQIFSANKNSVVYIESEWELKSPAGALEYALVRDNHVCFRAAKNGTITVRLTTNSINQHTHEANEPLRVVNEGSGFVSRPGGIIVTSKHVATPFETPYRFTHSMGLLVDSHDNPIFGSKFALAGKNWVPGEQRRRQIAQPQFDMIPQGLFVKFQNDNQSIRADVVTWSHEADIAELHIQMDPKPVEIASEPAKEADPIYVIGYPALDNASLKNSAGSSLEMAPQPVITDGIINQKADAASLGLQLGGSSEIGDVLVHSANAGQGSSGGPVFDKKGKVIGIHFAAAQPPGLQYAIPISYLSRLNK